MPLRLTNSSSATEAGEDKLNHETEPAASLCSLERVVIDLQESKVKHSSAYTSGSKSIADTTPVALPS